ncbi:hypothetical protein [Embleya sp. NBC_00896]|uniref:hypothetical protein n=1 Tax=Embleya sp. NBC_00896 TaxID=2975961 RepID=UPI003864BCCA|nr:hypothetical protein OG928_45745 [Embleya sp. NBC_00896]
MSYMRFCVMDVGQGSANYIELCESDDSLTAAAIIDVGSEQWKTTAGRPSAAVIAGRLKEMTGGAVLDAVILSHSDSDHINLISSLLEYFDTPRTKSPTKPVLTIKKIIFGGDFGKYQKGKAVNYLNQLKEYRPRGQEEIITRLGSDFSSFKEKKSSWKPLVRVGGKIDLWALSANTTAEKIPLVGRKRLRAELPDGGFAINTRSIVTVAIFAGRTIIATGDATGLSLAHCNELLAREDVRDKLGAAAYMLTLPHHGSDTTTYDLTGSGESDAGKGVVEEFCSWVKAETISASAGERSTFRHPSARVIKDFGANLRPYPQYFDPALEASHQHFYTAYFPERSLTVSSSKAKPAGAGWPPSESWYTVRTTENVYTTDYFAEVPHTPIPIAFPWEAREDGESAFKPPPPRAISWGFIVRQDGTTALEVVRERTSANAEYWAAVEAVHGPLPSEGFVVVPSAPPTDGGPAESSSGPLPEPEPEPPDYEPPSPPPPPSRLRQLP